ncbi:ester cyclase [Flavobacterium sp.]|uniref:ester cyclase n=1 Tax=Flavobacterium sp. TaxID=239 RepID=UPI0026267335|nr:ester cyclase [Flavobacterium sp.]
MSKEIITAFYEKALTVNSETTPEAVLSPILANDLVSYGSVDSKGKNELIGMLGYFWQLIPDLKWEIKEILQDGNRYIVRSKATGTPNGDFMGLPTDGTKSFEIMTIDIHTVENNLIQDIYHIEDWPTAMNQLKG